MFAGPIFGREIITAPRRIQHYAIRAGYVALLFILMYTIRIVTFGFQDVRNLGDLAKFGSLVFQIFSIVQLSLVAFFALLFSSGSVAQEKDRQTLLILMLTDLRDRELVLGKLFASLWLVFVLLLASAPAFFFVFLLGGTTIDQILWSLAICGSTAVAAGSWGSLVAFWREKTFQTLAIGAIGLLLFLVAVELGVWVFGANSILGGIVASGNPYRTLWAVIAPLDSAEGISSLQMAGAKTVLGMLIVSILVNVVTITRLRIWNPSRTLHQRIGEGEKEIDAGTGKKRTIWDRPVIWREIKTRAYGRKAILIKLAYFVLAVLLFLSVSDSSGSSALFQIVSPQGLILLALCLLSLMLINAQGVTSFTSERDQNTLELLLMTDITPKEFIFGKIGGVFFNAKEIVLLPILFVIYFSIQDFIRIESAIYFIAGFLLLTLFSATLGLHSGLSFSKSRSAIANSLGTMFFLFIGIIIFMLLLIEARSSFIQQFVGFLLFIIIGSIALYISLSYRNPSTAFVISAICLPFGTFYAMTEFLLQHTLGVCVPILAVYGFTTYSMLVPAVSEFDFALGRSSIERG